MKHSISKSPLKSPLCALLFLGSFLGFALVTIPDDVFLQDAEAVIGRPASPTSAAGVHRRQRRRTVRRTTAARRVTILPAGCTRVVTRGVTYHRCGGVYYRPYYEGNQVVYVEEAP